MAVGSIRSTGGIRADPFSKSLGTWSSAHDRRDGLACAVHERAVRTLGAGQIKHRSGHDRAAPSGLGRPEEFFRDSRAILVLVALGALVEDHSSGRVENQIRRAA